jgi:hypothetical protein
VTEPALPPLTVAGVKEWLRLGDQADDEIVGWSLAATLDHVATLPYIHAQPDPADPETWGSDARLGTLMLTARTYRRRNTPAGLESLGDQIAYTPQYDPDIERLLRVGKRAAPGVG